MDIKNFEEFKKLLEINLEDELLTYVASSVKQQITKCYYVKNGIIHEIDSSNILLDNKQVQCEKFHRFVFNHANNLIEDARSRRYRYFLLFGEDFIENETFKIYRGIRFAPKAGRGYICTYSYTKQSIKLISEKINWMS